MKDAIFHFTFGTILDDENETYISFTKAFIIRKLDISLIYNSVLDEETSDYINFRSKLEFEYGIHNIVGGGPIDEIEIFGFDSYEIEPEIIDTVMEKWRKYFLRLNCDVSKYIDITEFYKEEMTDLEIYNLVKGQLNV